MVELLCYPLFLASTVLFLQVWHTSLANIVGTVNDGYLRKVPLPRAPQIQSSDHVTCHIQVTHDNPNTGSSQVPRIPTWSNLTRLLATGGKNCSQAILSHGTTLRSTTHTKHNHNHSRGWKYDEPWRPPLHHGHHSALPPAPRRKTCSQHAMQQYYVIKPRQSYHYLYLLAYFL
jgi:hypothetical protein